MVNDNNQDKKSPEIVPDCRGEGERLEGGHRRGQRTEGSGQDEEKCCFKGVEGERWAGRPSTLPEAKQR